MQFWKRVLRRIGRGLTPGMRARQLRAEVDYWKLWFETKGLEWPQDYRDRFDPNRPLDPWLLPYIEAIDGETVEILDVGSGPLTKLGKVHATKRLSITATDQLADEYNAIIDQRGLAPPVRTRRADAEHLTETFAGRTFDVVHAENSIDHAQDAVAAIREMAELVRPGGYLLLNHAEHEGLNNHYAGLHHWDFLCEDGRFLVAGPGPGGARTDMSQELAAWGEVECWAADTCVFVAMKKR